MFELRCDSENWNLCNLPTYLPTYLPTASDHAKSMQNTKCLLNIGTYYENLL